MKPKQLRCLELVLNGVIYKKIALELGVSERTIKNWVQLPEFKKALEGVSFTPEIVSSVEVVGSHKSRRERLDKLVDASIDMLENIITSEDSRNADKIRAASLIGDWHGISKLPDYESALMVLSEYGWLPTSVVESAIEGSKEFQEKVKGAIAGTNTQNHE